MIHLLARIWPERSAAPTTVPAMLDPRDAIGLLDAAPKESNELGEIGRSVLREISRMCVVNCVYAGWKLGLEVSEHSLLPSLLLF